MDLRVRECNGIIRIGVIDTPEGHSHSTKVISIIKHFVPRADIILVEPNIRGLKKLIEEKPAIVNMSMTASGAHWLEDELAKHSFLVSSAGNAGDKGESFAAMSDRWCAVGAVDENMQPKYYSSYGYGKVKTVAVPMYGQGTSLTAPVVTGLLAQWYIWYKETTGYYPTVAETNEFVKRNSHDIWEDGKDLRTGYGLLRLPKTFETEKVTILNGESYAIKTKYVEGKESVEEIIELNIKPRLENDRTLVGSRDIAEAFGLNVKWDSGKSFYIRG